MKKFFGSMFIFCLTLALILGTFTFCFASGTKTGSFAFEIGKNSLGAGAMNIDLDLYLSNSDPNTDAVKAGDTGSQIDIEISQEQTYDELTKLHIFTSLQGDLFFTPKIFGFGGVSYERKLGWFDDIITLSAGAGYKIPNLKLQAGLCWAAEYSGIEEDMQSLLKIACDYTRKLYKPIDLVIEAEGVVNLKEIQALNDWEDYRINTVTMVKTDILEGVFLGIFYEWGYLDNANVTSQWEYGAKAGLNFI